MKKIIFNNNALPGISKQILEQLQDNIEEAINKKTFIKVDLPRQTLNVPTAWEYVIIPFASTKIESDNDNGQLEINNNAIVIKDGVQMVKVTGHTRGISHMTTSGDKVFAIRKNGINLGEFYQSGGQGYWGADVCNCAITVNKGDKIDCAIVSGGTGNIEILEGYLEVEVVKGE